MKCDEGKPGCSRCRKLDIPCAGYTSKNNFLTPNIRQLIPKLSAASSQEVIAIEPAFLAPRFSDETENRYFRFYLDEIASQMQDPFTFKTAVWDRLIPHAGEMQPYIKHAIIALGALSKSYSESEAPALSNPHQIYAFKAYGKALKGMREELRLDDISNSVVACLLVSSFESMQGHQAAASMHAASLVSVLYEQWSANVIKPQACAVSPLTVHKKSMEEDLLTAFSGLDIQALMFADQRHAEIHMGMKDAINNAVPLMPYEFESLLDCRAWWEFIMRRNLHFVAIAPVGETTANSALANILGPAWKNISSTGEANPFASFTSLAPTAPSSAFDIPDHIFAEQDRYIDDIWRWESAAEPIFADPSCRAPKRGEAPSQGYLQCSLMKLHASFNRVLVSRACLPPGTSYDAHLPEFQKQVELCELVAPHIGVNKSLTIYRFDLGIICPLSQISAMCRHSPTRARALRVIEACRGRIEGVYDAVAAMVIGKFFRDVEETDGGVDEEGWVKDDRKVVLKALECNVYDKTATVTLVRECDGFETVAHLQW